MKARQNPIPDYRDLIMESTWSEDRKLKIEKLRSQMERFDGIAYTFRQIIGLAVNRGSEESDDAFIDFALKCGSMCEDSLRQTANAIDIMMEMSNRDDAREG